TSATCEIPRRGVRSTPPAASGASSRSSATASATTRSPRCAGRCTTSLRCRSRRSTRSYVRPRTLGGFYDRELTRHTRDWKQIYDYGPPDGGALVPQFPRDLPAFRPAIMRFYEACDALALELVRAIAANLGMPRRALDRHFRPDHTSFMRLNYYPPCPAPARPADSSTARDGYLGVNAHTDAGALTLLLQDEQPGLEVLHDGTWHLVEPRDDALVVNIGDIVQVWSNDRYR